MDLEGRGVARREGKVVFVEGALPGERVQVVTTRSKASYETARTIEVVRASSERVAPRCPHFGLHPGACGGCSLQHMDARAQVAIKQRALEDTLWHIGKLRPQRLLRPIEGPAWHYRHRARLSVRYVAKKGGSLVGFHERASSYVADMRECHVLPARLSSLLPLLRLLIDTLSIRARLPQIEVAAGADGQMILVLRVLEAPSREDREQLQEFMRCYGVSFWLQPGGPATAAPLAASDPVQLALRLPEFGVAVPFAPTDFTQVNPWVNEVLVGRALQLLAPQPDDAVVDFFCGLGNFTLPLATRARRVIGLELHDDLLARACAAAASNGLALKIEFAATDLTRWAVDDWKALCARHGAIARVLLDPPREGALAIARALAAPEARGSRPQAMVYVSCNPATLARDCAVLVHEGQWQLVAAGVVNMFPHTAHVESVALLTQE